MRFIVAQTAQHRLPNGSLGFFGVEVTDGVLAARFGVATPQCRHKIVVPVGESVCIEGFGTVGLVDVHLGDDGQSTKALVEFDPDSVDSP